MKRKNLKKGMAAWKISHPAAGMLRLCLLLIPCVLPAGCRIVDSTAGERAPVSYTIPKKEDYPAKLAAMADSLEGKPALEVYRMGELYYVLLSYGTQKSRGYEIVVEELTKQGQTLRVNTMLRGPATKEAQKKGEACPILVICVQSKEDLKITAGM